MELSIPIEYKEFSFYLTHREDPKMYNPSEIRVYLGVITMKAYSVSLGAPKLES